MEEREHPVMESLGGLSLEILTFYFRFDQQISATSSCSLIIIHKEITQV